MHLTDDEFIEVIAKTPLVSIDLVIRDGKNRILMGRRVNEPAKGKWFVPGGRIRKDENLDEAFERICLDEIGEKRPLKDARLIGSFTHRYATNFKCIEGVSTHYVVLAYEIPVISTEKIDAAIKNGKQHSESAWFNKDDINSDIHPYSREYFNHLNIADQSDIQNLGK